MASSSDTLLRRRQISVSILKQLMKVCHAWLKLDVKVLLMLFLQDLGVKGGTGEQLGVAAYLS